MGVSLPGRRSQQQKLEKSTDQHKKRRQVKHKPNSWGNPGRSVRARSGPLEDLGNQLVKIFPVEMQYNIRATCRDARKAVGGLFQAACNTFERLFPDKRSH